MCILYCSIDVVPGVCILVFRKRLREFHHPSASYLTQYSVQRNCERTIFPFCIRNELSIIIWFVIIYVKLVSDFNKHLHRLVPSSNGKLSCHVNIIRRFSLYQFVNIIMAWHCLNISYCIAAYCICIPW